MGYWLNKESDPSWWFEFSRVSVILFYWV